MVENIKEIGSMENKMEKENFSTQIIKLGKRVFGVMEDEFNGIILLLLKLTVYKFFYFFYFN